MTAIKVLIIDDDPAFLMPLKMELEKRYKVMTAEDGIEARLMLECRNDFDLIVSDQSMPVMNGMKLFEWIGKEYPQTTKVLLTESSELTDEIKSQANENKFYCLNKSLELKNLITAIDQVIIGVKPTDLSVLKNTDEAIKIKTQTTSSATNATGCQMAVLDTNTQNWPTFDKLIKQSDLIRKVIYFRNPILLLERLKKDSRLGVVCINYKKQISTINDVIERISWLKHAANIILICAIDQASAAVEYQIKGKIYQRVIEPAPDSKILFEIEAAAKQFISDCQAVQAPKSPSCNQDDAHINKQSDSSLTQSI